MELKLFAAKRNCGYFGGLIVVAANDIEEAYNVYREWALNNEKPWIYLGYKQVTKDILGEYEEVSIYPRDKWYKIDGVEVLCDAPRVIDEDGYTE